MEQLQNPACCGKGCQCSHPRSSAENLQGSGRSFQSSASFHFPASDPGTGLMVHAGCSFTSNIIKASCQITSSMNSSSITTQLYAAMGWAKQAGIRGAQRFYPHIYSLSIQHALPVNALPLVESPCPKQKAQRLPCFCDVTPQASH